MRKNLLSIVSMLLALVMMLGMLASCTGGNVSNDTTAEGTTNGSTESSGSESESETTGNNGNDSQDEPLISGDNATLINLSNKLENGVSPYYTTSSRNELTISNTQVDLGFNVTHANGDMVVSHLSNKTGNSYIRDTMDVFITMKDGTTYYTGKTTNASVALNIYRYGYYYYENRLEGFNFINTIQESNSKEFRLKVNTGASHDIEINSVSAKDGLVYTITGNDPYVIFNDISFKADEFDYLEVKIKTENSNGNSEYYIIAGSSGWYSSDQSKTFSIKEDGVEHTYLLPLSEINDYTGTVKGLRLDINGVIGSEVLISGIRAIKASYGDAPKDLSVQRSFLTYSDKLHHLFQISAVADTHDVQEIGMITKIDASTVNGVVVKDIQGLHYDLNKIHWNSAEYIGFDIKDAGIFGYILPNAENSGKLKVTLEDGYYVIKQSTYWDKGYLTPSKEGTRNGDDFFMGQRLYTDTNHTFDTFIKEAECERNPLTSENIKVDVMNSDSGTFAGYNALYGYYKFTVAGSGFNNPYYKYPNKHYSVNFTVTGDQYDRQMYFMTFTNNGSLESAVLLDGKQMLLPVNIEVAKNFSGDGENTIYNLDDASYGEAYFPMYIKSGETKEYTVVNLYQNWGNVPLKQLSSIQFHVPYYHISTGVTETNCIVPFSVCGPGLPDFRTMSAPVWKNQPQHNSGGAHSFLRYTDSTGTFRDSQTTGVHIDSYGPTYCDITLDWVTSDGKMEASYSHIEMPQTDENRAYYEMTYTVLDDIEINDFRNKFTFYYCTDNSGTGTYQKLGYLDENNASQVADVAPEANYVLGDECPYFSLFMMPDWDRNSPHVEGYTNVAMLIYNYEFIINGEKVDARFYLRNRNGVVYLSLDLGDVVLKKGDTFTINAILMPWGSQELEDDPANRLNKSHATGYTEYTYSTVLPDGTLYMDKNVRDVRENTLLNPFKPTANKDCEVLDSAYVAKLKTTNGKSAEFTLSGGQNNNTIRVYGFDTLTVPKVEEFIDGNWVEVELSSINNPDSYGYGHYYDGYMVYYDGDGTYSYSFVAHMDNGAPRKFRITADEEFKGWPVVEETDDSIEDPINVFLQPSELLFWSANVGSITGALLDKGKTSIALSGSANASETFAYFFNNDPQNIKTTGQYAVLKYRLPSGISSFSNFEMFASTSASAATGSGDRLEFKAYHDDQWHVMIIDLSALESVTANQSGEYALNFVRWDFLNGNVSSEMYIDVAYFGIHDDLSEIYAMETNKEIIPTETPQFVEFISGGQVTKIDPKTGETYIPVYVAPDNAQGYTVSNVEYATYIDYINRSRYQASMHNTKQLPNAVNPTKQTLGDGSLVITGWTVADGGVEKYVWSADGGKTWHDVVMYNGHNLLNADDAMITAYGTLKQYTDENGNVIKPSVTDVAASKINGGYHGSSGISANLSDYYEVGTKLNVTFAAVPKEDTSSLCLIIHVTDVEVYVAPPIEPNATVNLPLAPEAIYNKVTNVASNNTFDSVVLSNDKSVIRFNAKANAGDQYGLMMNGNTQHTGQYLYLKYRIPAGGVFSSLTAMEIFTSTNNAHFQAGDNFTISVTQDGEWHVIIIDVSQKLASTKFGRDAEGRYTAKYLRVDVFEQKAGSGMYAEFAAMGFADNLNVIYKEICSDMNYVTVVGDSTSKIDPNTGMTYTPTYIDPNNAQGYTQSTVEYVAWLDMVNGKGGNNGTASHFGIRANHTISVPEFSDHCGTPLEGTQLLTISGWAVANGGIEKYVWSADGGKTWHDAELYNKTGYEAAGDAHLEQLSATGAIITDPNASVTNSRFQGSVGGGASTGGIAADLAEYAGQTVNVTFAAVPKADTSSLCIIIHIVGVNVPESAN